MKANNIIQSKKTYIQPLIDTVILDNEISLSLQSSPPEGPDEGMAELRDWNRQSEYLI
jgi:hypothetical protein